MSQKYDIESLLSGLMAHTKSKLGPMLSAITTEKGDGIALKVPDTSKAYYIQVLTEDSLNQDPYVIFSIQEPVETDSTPQGSAQLLVVYLSLVIADGGTDLNMWKRLYRYERAFKDIFELDWNKNSVGPRLDYSSEFLTLTEYKRNIVWVKLRVNLT